MRKCTRPSPLYRTASDGKLGVGLGMRPTVIAVHVLYPCTDQCKHHGKWPQKTLCLANNILLTIYVWDWHHSNGLASIPRLLDSLGMRPEIAVCLVSVAYCAHCPVTFWWQSCECNCSMHVRTSCTCMHFTQARPPMSCIPLVTSC